MAETFKRAAPTPRGISSTNAGRGIQTPRTVVVLTDRRGCRGNHGRRLPGKSTLPDFAARRFQKRVPFHGKIRPSPVFFSRRSFRIAGRSRGDDQHQEELLTKRKRNYGIRGARKQETWDKPDEVHKEGRGTNTCGSSPLSFSFSFVWFCFERRQDTRWVAYRLRCLTI